VFAAELVEARRVEDLAPGRELVEDETQRVDVAAHGRALSGELFRRHVGRSPGYLALDDVGRRHREAEVRDPRPATPVDHDVGGLQVPVQDAAVVRGSEARAELARDLERLVRRKPSDAFQ
jgi:hypothetical protein